MDIKALRYFPAVAREENMTQAAEALHVTVNFQWFYHSKRKGYLNFGGGFLPEGQSVGFYFGSSVGFYFGSDIQEKKRANRLS